MDLRLQALLALLLIVAASAEDCGRQAGGRTCPPGNCCSKWGWCGVTPDHCGDGCQSQCGGSTPPAPPSGDGIGSIITSSIFEDLLKHRRDSGCAGGFYTYTAFITAARSFPSFGNEGSLEERKRELAAFLAQTSKETTGGWATAPDGPYRWGYCFVEERNKDTYCQASQQWPCNGGKRYFGRGPIQLTWNFNYGLAGSRLGFDGINDPDIVSRDPVVSFKTAIWFWMTAQNPKPSCHDVILGKWRPSGADLAAGRTASYGTVTNIINGGLECGKGEDDRVKDRIGFFRSYCQVLGINPGSNLDCYNQRPFTQLLMEKASQ
ncbi:hypothetical protein SELMODRAFT_269217 [Selaginella moellendorffii]|uniref:Chitin-binding type-1 domain-containing protein n=1 Tax=Selaginella moellendorffii TaxID=88036 RepID=D8SUW5_SELML|nr:endochitinase A2 [Selaginella moellendorffii]EFJ11692.1 hypothetical protein SELMODRAFT_269217 [Selaginella moellendorffii]|eukprot:XP_002987116.1 endochitinase A2 [Selaginella moellendorffii]